MNRFWQTGIAVIATLTVVGMTHAQGTQGNQSTEIGSYQAILARSGYGDLSAVPNQATPVGYAPAQNATPLPPGSPSTNEANVAAGSAVGVAECGIADCTSVEACGCKSGKCLKCVSARLFGRRLRGGDSNLVAPNSAGDMPATSGTEAAADIGESVAAANKSSNWVLGVFGVSLRRDYEDRRRLGFCGPSDFYTTDVSNGDFSGVGVSLGKRCCTGRGWEAVFWGLSTANDVTIAGPTCTNLYGLSSLDHVPSGATVRDIYDTGDSVRLYRDTEIYNFEFNVLRNGGQYTNWRGANANYELLAGFRLFQFNEDFRYLNNSSVAGYPMTLDYALDAENTLAGFQVGGRNEVCLGRRWTFNGGASFGLFNNYIETRQRITDETGYLPVINNGPATGRPFDYSDDKNDAAVLGQFDIGLSCRLTRNARARFGYRAMGVAGVALAAHQIPVDFADPDALGNANANGELLLQGLVYGLEFCY